LELFVTREFKEFFGRDTWFTGESYGGVYVPTLTNLILGRSSGVLYPQLKGFMIGNPVFSCQDGLIGSSGAYFIEQVNLLYWHGLASYTTYHNWTIQGCNDLKKAEQPECQFILNLMLTQVGVINQEKKRSEEHSEEIFRDQQQLNWPSLDPDDIFQDFCTGNGTLAFADTPNVQGTCAEELGNVLQTYLNRADVQTAIHAKSVKWAQCTDLNYDISGKSMMPLYESFFLNKPGFKILVYSGDLDILTVPFAYTQPCMYRLSGKPLSAWQPWFVNGATAGYVETYDKYTYATVKGGGHECPLYQPLTSFQMIYRFLTTGNLNSVKYENVGGYRRPQGLTGQSEMLRRYGLAPDLLKKKY